jgi:hypothetical protein
MLSPNPFFLDKVNVLFFNIFIKNSQIHIIAPFNKKDTINDNDFKIQYNSTVLECKERIMKNAYEPIQILIYDFPYINSDNSDNSDNAASYDIVTSFRDIKKTYSLKPDDTTQSLNSLQKKYTLTLTTLFKNDYKLMKIFYHYYKSLGVEHFFMYYNGKLTPDIIEHYSQLDVTLIEWDFIYWNNNSCYSRHYAQMGQMHDALYRYGKNNSEYMIFCDLDEYMYLPNNRKLIDLVKERPIDSYYFNNVWANSIDDKIPDKMPDRFFIKRDLSTPSKEWGRHKCIHKVEAVNYLGIHGQRQAGVHKYKPVIDESNTMFHFHSWGGYKKEKTPILFKFD